MLLSALTRLEPGREQAWTPSPSSSTCPPPPGGGAAWLAVMLFLRGPTGIRGIRPMRRSRSCPRASGGSAEPAGAVGGRSCSVASGRSGACSTTQRSGTPWHHCSCPAMTSPRPRPPTLHWPGVTVPISQVRPCPTYCAGLAHEIAPSLIVVCSFVV